MVEEKWEETAATVADYGINIRCFRSRDTALRVIHADVKEISNGIVNGFFVLPTEAHDDDGCPHTLEHLVFMGSEDYPYKGVLDHLANRSFARGTNAWTDTDHTCYTLTTAGAEGFLNILPVYLDHILYPTITDSAFYTEVHHINGEGQDGGVVYSEMQGRENTSSSLSFMRLLRNLYPATGYASQTGGLMVNLRQLTVHKVRSYHRSYYRPDNLTVIVTGDIAISDILEALAPMEDKILRRSADLPPMKRPFSEAVPPLMKTSVDTVEFPDETGEGTGIVYVAWRGPLACRDAEELMALDLLWTYLTETSVAPLQANFVECDPPYCSGMGSMCLTNSTTSHVAYFSGVPMERLDNILPRLQEVLGQVVQDGLDMKRMEEIIKQRYHKEVDAIELSPHNTVSYALITYVMYGMSSDDLHKLVVKTQLVDAAAKLTNEQWIALLKRYYVGTHYVCILAKPSTEMSQQLMKDEQERIAHQREELGPERLGELEKVLDEVVVTNTKSPPHDLLLKFNIPDVRRISHIPVVTVDCTGQWRVAASSQNDAISQHVFKGTHAGQAFPFDLFFDHVKSNFVEISVHMDTMQLQPEQRLLLEIYKDIVFELPVRQDGELIPYEQVVQALAADISENWAAVGFGGMGYFSCGGVSSQAIVSIRLDAEKYKRGVQWIQKLLWQTEFNLDRIRVSANRLLNSIPNKRRSGSKICNVVSMELNCPNPQANHHACNMFRQQRFLKKLLEDIDSKPEETSRAITEFRDSLCQAGRMRIQVVADVLKMQEPLAPWLSLQIPDVARTEPGPVPPVVLQSQLRFNSDSHRAIIVPMATTESSFLVQTVAGPDSFTSDDVAPLKVLVEYLTAAEGVFWQAIRGNGLAYGTSMSVNVESGLISFSLYKSSNILEAYEASIAIVDRFRKHEEDFDDEKLKAAQSGQVFSLISMEETMSMAATQVFKHIHCTRLGADALQYQLDRIQRVTKSDLYRVLDKYLVHLFSPEHTNLVITANPSKVPEIMEAIKKYSPQLEQVDDLDAFFV